MGLGERVLDAWAVWSPKHRPLLAILGKNIADNRRAFLRQTLEEASRTAGQTALVIDRDFVEDEAYTPLLSQYLRMGRQLIWIDDNLNPEMADAVRAYAEQGGDFGLISGAWDYKMNTTFQREVLHFIGGQDEWEHGLWMAGALDFGGVSVPFDASVKLASRYIFLQPVAPARPALVDQYGRAAGLWAQTPNHRLVYLPFSLKDLKEQELPPLMEGLVAFFQQGAVEDASLEVAGHEAAEGKASLTFEARV